MSGLTICSIAACAFVRTVRSKWHSAGDARCRDIITRCFSTWSPPLSPVATSGGSHQLLAMTWRRHDKFVNRRHHGFEIHQVAAVLPIRPRPQTLAHLTTTFSLRGNYSPRHPLSQREHTLARVVCGSRRIVAIRPNRTGLHRPIKFLLELLQQLCKSVGERFV